MEENTAPITMPDFLDPNFPASDEAPEGMKSITLKDGAFPLMEVIPNIVYQSLNGEDQHMHLFLPSRKFMFPGMPKPNDPLIIYVPGSAWMRQDLWMGLSKAVDAVARGYAFAIVEYRPTELAIFPAQVEDAKSAIRYLRLHAEEYGIDGERVALWGDSSGGHTAVTVAITGDGTLENGENPGTSCKVKCVIDWFGPTEIAAMQYYPSGMDHIGAFTPEGLLIGGKSMNEAPEEAEAANPIHYLTADTDMPPILIMHGDKDNVVPFNQSVRLYDALRKYGKYVEFYKLLGAGHGVGGFASTEANSMAIDFADKYLR